MTLATRSIIVILIIVSFAHAQTGAPIRIACIGNSITYGSGVQDRDHFSYPAQLGKMLGPLADVRNFGVGGRTMLKHGDYPYWKEREFSEALAFNPNIVIIKLGTNDSKPWNWKYDYEYLRDYEAMVDTFAALPSHPEIYVCYPVPVFQDNYGIRDSIVRLAIIPKVDSVAMQRHVKIIDLYTALKPYGELFDDGVHPNAAGANLMAVEIFKHLLMTKFFSGKLPPYKNPSLSETERTEDLLKRMTLEEKITMLGGKDGFYIAANERLGIPRIKMADGPLGVRNYGESTAYPGGICMAAAWDTALEREVGNMVGEEARMKGVQIILAPAVNIHRAPMCGRNFEYFGEDPYLAGQTAASYIRGVQSKDVIATVKHFAMNNQEYDRMTVSSDADERTMQEIYLPAFKAAVDARVGSVMCSYNLINGVYAANNKHILTDILKDQYGFDGFIMSDWGATHDGVASANAGLDLEMSAGLHMNADTLLPAIKDGRISQATIDDKIRRMLRIMFRFGFLDHEQEVFAPSDDKLYEMRSRAEHTALQAAREGIVLLKNSGALPLDRSTIKEIALFGPNAHPAVTGGGGSSQISPYHSVSVFEGLSKIGGNGVSINYLAGIQAPNDSLFAQSQFVQPSGSGAGLQGEYFTNMKLEGPSSFSRIDTTINFTWTNGVRRGFPLERYSVRWRGGIAVPKEDDYIFIVRGDDGYRLYLDDKLIIDDWRDQGATTNTASVHLTAGSNHAVRLEYYQNGGDATVSFGYMPISRMISPRVADAASHADVAIVCVGFNAETESEGADRTFALPVEQERLIRTVAAANKRTIVLLNAGGNVLMTNWIDNVAGLVHCWYPGQEGGTAIAEILFGNVSPSGKLPVSFEKRWEDNATYASYYADSTKHVKYSEGIFLGYRHFDKDNIEPMFPFGFGLSYTTFAYDKLSATEDAVGRTNVSFEITNSGKVSGDEVAQVYVHQLNSSEPRPPKELKGFVRVSLKPGETQTARVVLPKSAFSFFSAKQNKWVVEAGEFEVMVGGSSRDVRLRKVIEVSGGQ